MELGIIGLPKSGKTTVFNALTRGRTEAFHSGGQSSKLNIGVDKVADQRVDTLVAMFHPKRTVQAEVRYVDIPWAPEGMGKSQGIGGEYLNVLQRTDALLHVVRAFDEPSVPHVQGSVDPYRDAANIHLELAFSDLAIIERRFQRLEAELKSAKVQEREASRRETTLLTRLKEGIEKDVAIREQELTSDEVKLISAYQFLTAKPMLVLFNISEAQLPQAGRIEEEARGRLGSARVLVATMCAKLEADLAQLLPAEEEEFRRSLEAGEPGTAKVTRHSYQLLGLISFFTTGPDEVKAWTIREGTPAVKAAGQIHSDIERGFIRAEVISYEDMARCGTIAEVRRQGRLRLEGKTYTVKDGDVIEFLFNV